MKEKLLVWLILFLFINPAVSQATTIVSWDEERPAVSDLWQNIKICPQVKLPAKDVIFLGFPGPKSRFEVIFKYLDDSFDVKNGTYPAWCGNKDTKIKRNTEHEVRFFSSCNIGDMPPQYRQIPWSRINYILNNKSGYLPEDVQEVIWWLTNHSKGKKWSKEAQFLLDEANEKGADFVPEKGQVIAIICDTDWGSQFVFFELVILEEKDTFAAPPPAVPPAIPAASPFWVALIPAPLPLFFGGGECCEDFPPDNPKPPPSPPPNPPVPELPTFFLLGSGLVFFILRRTKQEVV